MYLTSANVSLVLPIEFVYHSHTETVRSNRIVLMDAMKLDAQSVFLVVDRDTKFRAAFFLLGE